MRNSNSTTTAPHKPPIPDQAYVDALVIRALENKLDNSPEAEAWGSGPRNALAADRFHAFVASISAYASQPIVLDSLKLDPAMQQLAQRRDVPERLALLKRYFTGELKHGEHPVQEAPSTGTQETMKVTISTACATLEPFYSGDIDADGSAPCTPRPPASRSRAN